jgi:hypothetical protein
MKKALFAIVAASALAAGSPCDSHAVGLVKYLFDAMANTLGLDRGGIPKVLRCAPPPQIDEYGARIPRHVYVHDIHIQAEGF